MLKRTERRKRKQRRLIGPLILLLASSTLPGAASWAVETRGQQNYAVEKATYDLSMNAKQLSDAKNYSAAAEVLQRAAANDPTSYSASIHENLSSCYYQLENFPRALSEAAAALKYDQQSSYALHMMALSYKRMGNVDKYVDYMQRYAKVSGDLQTSDTVQKEIKETRVYENLQEAYRCIQAHKEQQAISLLVKAAAYDPTSFSEQVHAQLAYAYGKAGAPAKAVDEAKRALALDPTDKQTTYGLGIAYGDMAKFDEAMRWVSRYAEMETDGVQRQDAVTTVKMFQLDKEQLDSAPSKKADYTDTRPASYERWSQQRLPIKVAITRGTGVRGYRKDMDSFIVRALDAWCDASGKKLDYKLVDDAADADIKVVWTDRPIQATEDHPGTRPAGLTSFDNGIDTINGALITISTVDSFDNTKLRTDGQCAPVCLHEVGHSLGLAHSTNIADTMYYRTSSVQTGSLTARDKATMARLYADYPALQFRPKAAPAPAPKFMPTPTITPPKPQDPTKLAPPLFLPPPIQGRKLQPPLFTPPPLSSNKPAPAAPLFVPPPKKESKPTSLPFFTPPPKK